jgi:hypothetical protein
MEDLKKEMRQEAEEKHGKIYPSGRRNSLDDCYTEHDNKLMFWFNLEDQTTKAMVREIQN